MLIKHKRGDTINWECEFIDDAGTPVDLSTYTIKCQARDKSGKLLFSVSSNNDIDIYAPLDGKFRLTILDTTKFDTNKYDVDIQYTIGTLIKSSDTFQLEILKDITQ
jgi:hypothetical protein